MTYQCEKCGKETNSLRPGPDTDSVAMCGLCYHEATGKGAVVDCVECRERRYLGVPTELETFLLEARLCR